MTTPRELAVLLVRDPAGGTTWRVVDRPALQVGSAADRCGLVLAGPDIAALHCCLRWRRGRWWLLDRGSAAGTYLNNRRCREPTALHAGDRISVGLHLIEFSTRTSLEPSHVLERLGDAPSWPTELRVAPPEPPPTPRLARSAPWVAALAAAASLACTLALARTRAAEPPDLSSGTASADPEADLSQETSVPTVLSSGTSAPRAASDLSSRTSEPAADLSSRTSEPAAYLPSRTSEPAAYLSSGTFAPRDPADLSVPRGPASDLSQGTSVSRDPASPGPSSADASRGTLATASVRPPPEDPSRGASATPPRTAWDPSRPTVYVTEPPAYELPDDTRSLGRPDAGALEQGIQLPTSPDYQIRCAAHSFGTSATIGELMHTMALMRNRGYEGELVVGDLSREDGGQYGPHRSHQSGRDVDLWLPVRGGRYRRGCDHCGTDMCRPEPEEVDWPATWRLIQALAGRDAVQDIFLDWSLHPALRDAAAELGTPVAEIDRQIQYPRRGHPTLVKHSDGHVHHLHVRFRE